MTEKKKQNNNVKAHDRFFKKSMSYPEIAQEFFFRLSKIFLLLNTCDRTKIIG